MNPVVPNQRASVVLAAVLAPVVVAALLIPVRQQLVGTNLALILVVLVVAAAATGRRLAGIGAALTSALSFDFFLTAPYQQLRIADPADVETAVLLLVVGAAVTEIAIRGRRQQLAASRQRGILAGMLDTSQKLAAGSTPAADLVATISAQLVDLLRLDRCELVDGVDPTLPVLHSDGTLERAGRPVAVEREGLPTDTEIALPAHSGGAVRGCFLLVAATRVSRPTLEQRQVACALADLSGSALNRRV